MARRALCLVLACLGGCAHEAAPPVLVAVPPASARADVAPPRAEERVEAAPCVIDGDGEHGGSEPFVVGEQVSGAQKPVVRVAAPASVRVRWSALPSPAAGEHRIARAALGGQGLRLDGWAELAGRSFQIRARARVFGDRVWIRGGSEVELLGEDARGVWVRTPTPLSAPKQVDGVLACVDVLYVPEDVPPVTADWMEDRGPFVVASRGALSLLAEPAASSPHFDIEPDDLILSAVERRDGFVRVTGNAGALSFDAWVTERSVKTTRTLHGGGSDGGSSGARGVGWSSRWRRGTVRSDTPLFVERDGGAEEKTSAVVEKGARVVVTNPATPGAVRFFFEHRKLEAPEGTVFLLDEAAVHYD